MGIHGLLQVQAAPTISLMQITVNQDPVDVDPGSSILDLLRRREIPTEHTAVELNGQILDRTGFDRVLQEGDEIVIVRFVGGG